MSKNDNKYGELLCEAMGILADSALGKISFDRTIVATITDDSEKEGLGKYRVSTGEATFDAYSSNTSFKNGDNVYVQIPNGDWNEQKIIVSKKVNNTNDPIAYKDPLGSFVDISENLIKLDVDKGPYGLLANGSVIEKELWTDTTAHYGYTRLAIKANFKSLLKKLGAESGNYGLVLELGVKAQESNATETVICELSCQDMVGDPYNFDVYFEQKKLFDISKYNSISSMSLYFVQNRQFKDIQGAAIKYENLPNNLFVDDISISLGYDINEFSDGNDTVILYTMDSPQYDIKLDKNKNLKKLQTRWIHKFDNGNFQVVKADDEIKYELTWYKQVFGIHSDNVYSGVDWAPLSRQTKTAATKAQPTYTKITDYYPADISDPGYNYSYLMPDAEFKKEEKTKVQIIYWSGDSKTVLTSNILIFENVDDVVNKATIDYIQGLNISCTDNTNGNYPIYGLDGRLLDSAESQADRAFKLLFFNTVPTGTEKDSESILTDATWIEWIIPAKNTMIQLAGEYEANEDGYYYIEKSAAAGQTLGEDDENDIVLPYRIKSSFSYAYGNNLVRCNIIRNNKEYSASKDLTFSTAGTSGTDYTFSIELYRGPTEIQALTIDDEAAVIARAVLKDYKGDEMDISQKTIKWSWTNYDSKIPNPYINTKSSTGKEIELQLKENISNLNQNYSILVATLSDWGDYDLKAYLPIPITNNSKYSITGANIVQYNSLGNLDSHSFYNGVYELHGTTSSVSWSIETYPADNYSPKLKNNKLSLPPVYIEESSKKVCVLAKIGNTSVWSQPIYIYQQKYPSSIVNEWNGELIIDNDKNAILAAKVVAGKKNNDNTFSGVMMGDWEGDETSHADGAITENTGIYGFQKGIPSFGFKDDGTAFIGMPGTGRLELNGDKGKIESSGYSAGGTGMLIDFGGKSEIPKIDMKYRDGDIESSILLQANDNGSEIYLKKNDDWFIKISSVCNNLDRDYPLRIGRNFYVKWDGTINATGGVFKGSLQASDTITKTLAADILNAGNGSFDSLRVENYVEAKGLYFGGNLITTYIYYKRDSEDSAWVETSAEDYRNNEGNPNYKRVSSTSVDSSQEGTGFIGMFQGNHDGYKTAVVGLRNSGDNSTVIEGSGHYLRIGNNKSVESQKDTILLSGQSIRFHTNGIVGHGDDYISQRFFMHSNALELKCYNTASSNKDNKHVIGGLYLAYDLQNLSNVNNGIMYIGAKQVAFNAGLFDGLERIEEFSVNSEKLSLGTDSGMKSNIDIGYNTTKSASAIQITSTDITFNCPASQQHGIYARFA